MTTLEIVLLSSLIYLLIGIAIEFYRPEEYFMVPDPRFERFLTVMTIFFWPVILICRIIDYMRDTLE